MAARSYFHDLYYDQGGSCITKQLHVVRNYPQSFNIANSDHIGGVIYEFEVLETLKGFKKDKSLGLDEWTVEICLHFFYLLGNDVVEATNDT